MNKIIHLTTYEPSLEEKKILENLKIRIMRKWPLERIVLEEITFVERLDEWKQEAIATLEKAIAGKMWNATRRKEYIEKAQIILNHNEILEKAYSLIALTNIYKTNHTIYLNSKNLNKLIQSFLLYPPTLDNLSHFLAPLELEQINDQIKIITQDQEEAIELFFDYFLYNMEERLTVEKMEPQKAINFSKYQIEQALKQPSEEVVEQKYYFETPIVTLKKIYEILKRDLKIVKEIDPTIHQFDGYSAEDVLKINKLSQKQKLLYLNTIAHLNRYPLIEQTTSEDLLRLEQILKISNLFATQDKIIQNIQANYPNEQFAQQLIMQVEPLCNQKERRK